MDITWLVFFAVASFYLAILFDLPLESQQIAKEVTKDLVIGYLGYVTHEVKNQIREIKQNGDNSSKANNRTDNREK